MKPDRWLIVPVEVQVRELLARLLVAAIAADRGYNVLIGQDRVIRRLARYLPRGILFDKSLDGAGDRKVRRYQRLGYTIAAIDEESRGVYSDSRFFFSRRLSDDALSRSARWFCLSDLVRQEAIRYFPGYADRFETTGLPRVDLCRPQFHAIYDAECAAIRKQHGPYILFCSNFGTILHIRRGRFLDHQMRKAARQAPGNAKYRERIETEGRANLTAFLEMLPKLREWFPDHKLLVRPHPTENHEFWQNAFAGIGGVEIVSGGSANPWILASDCLVHHGCTTGIEAELLGKPHVMYAPYPDFHHDTELMKTFAPIVHDEESLRDLVSRILAGHSFAKPRNSLEKYYAALEGRLASERVTDEFDRLAQRGGELPQWLPWLRYTPRHLVAEYGLRSSRARAYSLQKWQGTSLAEIRATLEVLRDGAAIATPVEVSEIFPQLFLLARQ